MEEYYFNHMTKSEQSVYRLIHQGLEELASDFLIPKMEMEKLRDVFFYLRLDHPEIFWAVDYRCKYYRDSPNMIIEPEYLFQKNKVKDHQKAMKARVEKLAKAAQNMTEEEKEKYVHDFICENVKYDKLKKPYSHEIIGPLGQGVGVCEGIAKSVKVLCDALHVWCIIAICGNNPEKGIKYRHTWNILRINGKYYHLDATFDNSLGKGEEIRYDYYNLDDHKIFRDHEAVLAKIPACTDGDSFFYKYKKMSFTKSEEVYKRSLQAARKGKTLTFHWRGGYLTSEVFQELLTLMEKAGTERCKSPHISVNWSQAVIRVHYADKETDSIAHITTDEPNEGEECGTE